MKSLLFAIYVLLSPMAFAKTGAAPYTPQTLSDGQWGGQNSIYFSAIPYADGLGFGFGYEKSLGSDLGIGGNLTFLPDKKNATVFDAPTVVPGLVAFGGNVRLHFPAQFLDFYIAPGLNIMMMKVGEEDGTTIGGSFAMGSLAQFNRSFAMGIEMSVFHPWFNKNFYAVSRGYYFNTGITARVTF